jgi:hypothetical protein
MFPKELSCRSGLGEVTRKLREVAMELLGVVATLLRQRVPIAVRVAEFVVTRGAGESVKERARERNLQRRCMWADNVFVWKQ